LEKALRNLLINTEQVTVTIIQSKDVIEEIISSDRIQRLIVTVSYTNDDIGDAAQELMDSLLKEGKIGQIVATLKPDQNGNLATNSKIVRGLLEMAKDNGEAEATIVNDAGKKEKIVTSNYPEKFNVTSESEDSIKVALFQNMMKEHRSEIDKENIN
jgi:hypothetical protein